MRVENAIVQFLTYNRVEKGLSATSFQAQWHKRQKK